MPPSLIHKRKRTNVRVCVCMAYDLHHKGRIRLYYINACSFINTLRTRAFAVQPPKTRPDPRPVRSVIPSPTVSRTSHDDGRRYRCVWPSATVFVRFGRVRPGAYERPTITWFRDETVESIWKMINSPFSVFGSVNVLFLRLLCNLNIEKLTATENGAMRNWRATLFRLNTGR